MPKATEHILNEAGRKKIEDDDSSFHNFPKDKAYPIRPGIKKATKRS